jgi:hypothetical protein
LREAASCWLQAASFFPVQPVNIRYGKFQAFVRQKAAIRGEISLSGLQPEAGGLPLFSFNL